VSDEGAPGAESGPITEAEHVAQIAPRRRRLAEPRWPMALAVIVAAALQLVLPHRRFIHPTWLAPVLEVVLLLVIIILDPGRIDKRSMWPRALTMALIAVMTISNISAVIGLVVGILENDKQDTATRLLAVGTAIWLTNILVASLWYWELDRGGPSARAIGGTTSPAFAFPEMISPHYAPPDWSPRYVDYLYLGFTNATAFSPTDTMPVKSWAKLLMMAQSAISLVTGIMIISRAINILT
jgi:uncharacterized membrane protein